MSSPSPGRVTNQPYRQNAYSDLEEGEVPIVRTTADVLDYLNHLQEVVLGSLPEESTSCNICHDPYETGGETITMLPCSHVFGSHCIAEWLSPDEAQGHNTCPMCRSVLFVTESDNSHLATAEEVQTHSQSNPELASFVARLNNEEIDHAFGLMETLVDRFPDVLAVNRHHYQLNGNYADCTLVSDQLMTLFSEMSFVAFLVVQDRSRDRLRRMLLKLGRDLAEHLEFENVISLWYPEESPMDMPNDPLGTGMIARTIVQMVQAEARMIAL